MIIKILLGLGVLVIGFGVAAALQPDNFRYSRSATIAAPASVLFAQVNNLRAFQEWNPWAKMDPNAKITYSGPASGVGASYAWTGNGQIGEGTMTITEVVPDKLVRCHMDFRKPMKATHTAEFAFAPEGDSTVVTWSMSGTHPFLAKAMGLLINCDKMVGKEFEKGLATLKTITEKPTIN